MNEYKIQKIIGQGAFGNAYLATHLTQNKAYVIKKIELTNKNQEQTENIFNQVKLLEEFKHVNIVSYRESIIEGQELNIVMEFCVGGDLNQLIVSQKEEHQGRKLEEKKIVDWAAQIALAIFYMHDKRILHRDLKTPNIFISDNIVKLGDFGISKVLDEKVDLASTSIGTPYYMSPEQYKHKPYSYKSDMWAFGCILYEMCNQKRPFEAYSLNGLAVKVLEANFSAVSEFYSRQLREIIHKMLQKKEKDRPSILEFLQTPFIKKRAAAYLKQTYNKLVSENGDKVLIEGVIYQAKKLGIALGEKKEAESQKKSKPEFSAEKKRQQKQRIRLQLEEELKKISEKDKQQKEQLKKLTEDRKSFLKKNKKDEKSQYYARKPVSPAPKSSREQSTIASEQRQSQAHSVKPLEDKQKAFEIKQKYDMYEMEYEQEESEDDEKVEVIDEKDEEEEREAKQEQPEKELKVQQPQKQIKQEQPKPYEKEKYVKPTPKQIKAQAARFTQLGGQQSSSKIEPQVPIDEVIINLKESLKMNMEILNTIKNQLSNIDFQISSSDDELEKTIQKPEELPVMKKRQKNPVHVTLSDKINDLKKFLEFLLPKESIQKLIKLAQLRGTQVSRSQIEKVVGSKQGTYHLALEMVKLNTVLLNVPLYS